KYPFTKTGAAELQPEDQERLVMYGSIANPTVLPADLPPPAPTQHPEIHAYLWLRWDAPLSTKPGTQMAYADHNYILLGEIVRRVSGQSLAALAAERIFTPLGMRDTSYIVPHEQRQRIVRRAADSPGAALLDRDAYQDQAWGSDGVFSTALDMSIFGQMFLNRGTYGDVQILSPASVTEMTRNQIPGIAATFFEEYFPEAAWGFGWSIRATKMYGSVLCSPGTFDHGGMGGVSLRIDPVHEIVAAYFSIWPRQDERWNDDLLMSAAIASIQADS